MKSNEQLLTENVVAFAPPVATEYLDIYKGCLAAMEEKEKQGLPVFSEVMIKDLYKVFNDCLELGYSSEQLWIQFLPAIQEYVAGKKAAIKLTDSAQTYYNEVAYSLDYGNGEVATMEQVLSHCLEELAEFENKFGESVTGWMQGIKQAEENSETPEKAKEYLQSHGIDTEALVSRGMEFINQVKVNIEQKKLIASKDAQIVELKRLLLEDETGVLKAVVAGKDAEIKALLEQMEQRNDDVISANTSMSHYKALFEETEKKLTESERWYAELEKENASLKLRVLNQATEQLEAKQTGPVWVNASDRYPDDITNPKQQLRNAVTKEVINPCDILAVTPLVVFRQYTEKNDLHLSMIEWLDESAAVPDARQEALAFGCWLTKNSGYDWWDFGKYKDVDTREIKLAEDVYSEFKEWQKQQEGNNV